MDQVQIKALQLRLQQRQEQSYNIEILANQFIEYCREHNASSTVPTRATHMKQFVEFCKAVDQTSIYDINNVLVDVFFGEYAKTHVVSTVNACRRTLKVFLGWLYQYKEMNLQASAEAIRFDREKKQQPRALPMEVIKLVVSRTKNEQDKFMIAIAVESGMRIGELERLKVSDIHGQAIRVYGKGSVERTVYISKSLASNIQEYVYERAKSGIFFKEQHWGRNTAMPAKTMRVRMQRLFLDIASVHMTPHQLRHTFALNLLKQGCDIVTIKNLLGHEDIQTTMKYLRVDNKHLREQYEKYRGESVF